MIKYINSEITKLKNTRVLLLFLVLLILLSYLILSDFFKNAQTVFSFWKTTHPKKSFDYFLFTSLTTYVNLLTLVAVNLLAIFALDVDFKSRLFQKMRTLPVNIDFYILSKILFAVLFFILFFASTTFIILQETKLLQLSFVNVYDISFAAFLEYLTLHVIMIIPILIFNLLLIFKLKFRYTLAFFVSFLFCLILSNASNTPLFKLRSIHLFLNDNLDLEFILVSLFWSILLYFLLRKVTQQNL